MKKIILLVTTGFLFAATGSAQVQRQMPQRRGMQSDSSHHFERGKMMQQLNLTAEQKTQMKALHEDMQQQRNAIQTNGSLSADQKKEQMKDLHKSQMEKMNAILTPEQQAKMKTFRERGTPNPKMRQRPRPMMDQLDLTADQKSQMKALHETMQQQRNTIQNDASLSEDQKKEKMKDLHKSQMEKMNAILTPEQQAKMKALREQHRQNHRNRPRTDNVSQPQQS